VVEVAADEDPDSFLADHTAEELQSCFDRARPVLQVFLEHCLTLHGDSIEGKVRAAKEMLDKLRLLPNELERDLYLKELAKRTGLDEALLKKKALSSSRASPKAKGAPLSVVAPPQRRSLPPAVVQGRENKFQEVLLHLMKINPEICGQVAEATPEALFSDADRRAIAAGLIKSSDEEGKLDEDRLLNGLSDDQKAILSGIIVKDDEALAEDPTRIFADCKMAVEREQLKARIRVLQKQIEQSERDGDSEGRAKYQRELFGIQKKIRMLR
jgi:DNA primase